MKKAIIFLTALFVMGCISASAFAQEAGTGIKKKEPTIKSQVKEIVGEVATLGSHFISLVYSYDQAKGEELEMLIPFDPRTVKIEHLRSLKEISTGDRILVQYMEDVIDYGDRQDIKFYALTIRFLNPVDAHSRYKPKASVQEQAAMMKAFL